ncbi:hypothetical protein GCM10009841_04100 [Microlunatus panaciterrae]|uniref:Membrane protein involved in the export of O-antigen and teichoic acid n=1 Tax=Microlunatus panaciterrae TaxID=400768 RepID=A0ABS2RL83_9ACTN|nr:hypothetical protein [Microlunatus panaciterrae]MBM7798931.1 hypothetical protein [Microlunatus panaciterrae]
MNPLALVWADIRTLVVDTGRLWWRLLPQLVALYLLGWLGYQLALKLAVAAGDLSAWLALVVFSFGFLSKLGAIILMLRLAGRELHIKELIPPEERVEDRRDDGISHLLAITLLPFLGIYAAFGEVAKAADELATEQLGRNGVFGDNDTVLGVLYDAATKHPVRLAAIVVGVYALRRLVDLLHERTDWRPLGVVVALIESFFMLLVILGAQRLFQSFMIWVTDRAIVGWFASFRDRLADLLSVLKIDLPAVLVAVGDFLSEQVWPAFADVLSQPISWLAVAALIFGSNVISIAELWRKGQPIASRAPGARRVARVGARLPLRAGQPPIGMARVGSEIRAAFLGDIDDKYLPTFHSIRLVLRAGAVFLGAYVLVYAIQEILQNYLHTLVITLVGGHLVGFWQVTSPIFDLVYTLPFEPLRICLLAVAFHRCLLVFLSRAHPQDRVALPELAGVR